MTTWRGKGVPDWEQLQSRTEGMWQKPTWAKGVLIDNASSAPGSPELFRRVQVACYSTDAFLSLTLTMPYRGSGGMYRMPSGSTEGTALYAVPILHPSPGQECQVRGAHHIGQICS